MYNNLPLTNNYILSATNWWNTSRMLGSRSWVNSSVSRVVLYRSTCNKELEVVEMINSTNLFMMKHENLVEPSHSPEIPRTLEIHCICVAPHQMLGQDHDEPLEDDQEQVLLVSLSSF